MWNDKKDAMEILKAIQDSLEENDFLGRCALDMAIEALQENESLAKTVIEASELLRKQRQHGEWIPCSERLPDLFEVVLVTDECGNVFEYERRPLDYNGNVCREWSFLSRNIIAWMPLPEPYKRGESE